MQQTNLFDLVLYCYVRVHRIRA